MKKDKDADKTSTMDVIMDPNLVQGADEAQEGTVIPNEKLQESISFR